MSKSAVSLFLFLFHWANHRFYKRYFLLGQAIFFVKHLVCPRMREVLEGDELINITRSILSFFLNRHHISEEASLYIRDYILAFLF